MSLAVFFEEKCLDALKENVSLTLKKLSNPKDFITSQLSDLVQFDAEESLGALRQYATDYIKENADKVALRLIQATGVESYIRQSIDAIYNTFAVAYLTYDTFVLYLLKIIARRIVSQIDEKRVVLLAARQYLVELHNALLVLSKGDDVYDEYLENVREAYRLLLSAESGVSAVRGTLSTSGAYLAGTYANAQDSVSRAIELLRGIESGGGAVVDDSYLNTGEILSAYGIPGTPEQIQNLKAIPRLCWAIIKEMRTYSALVFSINGLLDAYYAGISAVTTALSDNLRRYSINLLSEILSGIQSVRKEMPEVAEVKTVRVTNPLTGTEQTIRRQPNPATVGAHSIKWIVDLSAIHSQMKLLPKETLSGPAYTAEREDVAVYLRSVEILQSLGNVGTGDSVLQAEQAKEKVTGFEQQLLTMMLQSNAAISTALVGNETLSLALSMIRRLDSTVSRDDEIKAALQTFIDYELQSEAALETLLNGVNDLMEKAGLDRAVTLFQEGKLDQFFSMSSRDATFVGAGLAAVALLKQCFDTVEEQGEITRVQRELEREQDLVNLKTSFDFDLAIFNNLDLCLRVRGLSTDFKVKEFLCDLAEDAGVGTIFTALNDVVSF